MYGAGSVVTQGIVLHRVFTLDWFSGVMCGVEGSFKWRCCVLFGCQVGYRWCQALILLLTFFSSFGFD